MTRAAVEQNSNAESSATKLIVKIRTANVSEEIVASAHSG
jgi:hypothetical protein